MIPDAGPDGGRDRADDSARDRGSHPFDVGLQPERTALAWRRTALALIVAALIGIRVFPTIFGAGAIIPAATGIALAVAIFVASHRRYHTQHERLTTAATARIALPDGRLPAVVATSTALAGLTCVAVIASIALR